jgi:predicted aconitase
VEDQKTILEDLGLRISYTCTPHLVGNHPYREEVVAWGGRAAVSFVNSVMGARSEVETNESALASAITGLTPERGLHLDRNREATVAVVAPDWADLTALGFALSRDLHGDVPLLCGVRPTFDEAKRLAFSLNTRGSVPLFKMQRGPDPPIGLERLEVSRGDLETALDNAVEPDLVIVGCPHMSEQDINRWSKLLSGRPTSRTDAWFFTSRLCMDKCPIFGAVLKARGRVFVDACPLAMREELIGRSIACDSPGLAECLTGAGLKAAYLPDAELLARIVGAAR